MFKTEGYIEKFAKLLTDQMEMENYTKEQVCIAIEEVLKDFQKDLLESASKDSQDAWINYRKGEGHSFGHKEALEYGWQSAKLSSKAQIDTLKQRELGYQSDLRQKCEEIERLKERLEAERNDVLYMDKQCRELKEEIEKLKEEIRNLTRADLIQTNREDVLPAIQEATHYNWLDDQNEKLETQYQQAVKDIEWLAQLREYDTYTELDQFYAIKAKYGLDKKGELR